MSNSYWPLPDWAKEKNEKLSSDQWMGRYNRVFYSENMLDENDALKKELAEARQTIEDIAIGVQLLCPKCHQYHPCNCDK